MCEVKKNDTFSFLNCLFINFLFKSLIQNQTIIIIDVCQIIFFNRVIIGFDITGYGNLKPQKYTL